MKIQNCILKTTFIVFVMLLLNTNAFGNKKNSTVKIVNAERKVFTLNLKDARTKDYAVQISDVYGVVLFEDEILASKKSSKIYDLSKLPAGKYEVEIEGDIFIRKQFVEILDNKLEVVGDEEIKVFKPFIELNENKIALNMFSHGNEPVQVSILDVKNEVLFAEKIEENMTIHKYYDLSQLPEGEYIVKVESQGNYFYKEINWQRK